MVMMRDWAIVACWQAVGTCLRAFVDGQRVVRWSVSQSVSETINFRLVSMPADIACCMFEVDVTRPTRHGYCIAGSSSDIQSERATCRAAATLGVR